MNQGEGGMPAPVDDPQPPAKGYWKLQAALEAISAHMCRPYDDEAELHFQDADDPINVQIVVYTRQPFCLVREMARLDCLMTEAWRRPQTTPTCPRYPEDIPWDG